MWETDRKVLDDYKQCYADVIASLKAGEEVEYADMCATQTKNL